MRIETDMPLSSLIEKLLRGEAAEFHDEDFRTYVDSKMGNNHELLQQALNEIEDAIDNWKCSYFISVYDERVNAYRTGTTQWTSQDLDDLFVEEECLRKEGKIALTVDYLYDEIEKIGFVNEHHCDAMDMARLNNDIDFLKSQWEDLALAQIRSLEGIVKQYLTIFYSYDYDKKEFNKMHRRKKMFLAGIKVSMNILQLKASANPFL